jgi:hypothetical protein
VGRSLEDAQQRLHPDIRSSAAAMHARSRSIRLRPSGPAAHASKYPQPTVAAFSCIFLQNNRRRRRTRRQQTGPQQADQVRVLQLSQQGGLPAEPVQVCGSIGAGAGGVKVVLWMCAVG